MIAAIVAITTLGKAVLYSLVAGVGIAVVFGAGSRAPRGCSMHCASDAPPPPSPGARLRLCAS
jgi:hypothetical protein